MIEKYANIVFDMGKVLIDYNPENVIRHYTDNEEQIREVKNLLFLSSEWILLDAGFISEEEGIKRVLPRFKNDEDRLLAEKCFKHWHEHNMFPKKGMDKVVEDVKKRGQKVYILSNASKRLPKYYRDYLPRTELYDGVFFSCDYKCLKPQEYIYNKFLDTFNLNAKDCFFIDDLAENIEGARAVGINGYCFSDGNVEKLRKVLELD